MPRERSRVTPWSRRQFVGRGTGALALTVASPALGRLSLRGAAYPVAGRPVWLPPTRAERADPARLKQLALQAMDAAKAAGAQYADVRLTRTVSDSVGERGGTREYFIGWDDEALGVGVRCLVNGYWGFAASPFWTPDAVATLARKATAMAQANAKGPARPIEWSPVPAVTGDWTTPITVDPFTVSFEERAAYMAGVDNAMERWLKDNEVFAHRGRLTANGLSLARGGCWRQEQVLATSEGTCCTQTFYRTEAPDHWAFGPSFRDTHPTGRGWEVFRDAQILAQLPALYEQIVEVGSLPEKELELGRYDLVLDGSAATALVHGTLARATELDRALGYEANASGTSYLGPDVLSLLGQRQVGSSLLTLTTNRTLPHGTGTWQWDVEGSVPAPTTLIQDGVLVDYQTTREQAGWLRPYYEKAGKPVRSQGNAWSATALDYPLQHTPNMVLEAGQPGTPVAEMVKNIKKGLYLFWGASGTFDFQAKTGTFSGRMREITNGKLGATIKGAQVLFSADDLWKNLIAVGPASESQAWDYTSNKGQPGQTMAYTVQAPPLAFKNQTVIHG